MNHILTTALLALAAGASAGLPKSGLPAGKTDVAFHLSNETVDQTQIGKALTSAFQADVDANKIVIALKKELGFELDEDFRDVTAVGNAGDEKSFVALLRGKFNKARIEAFANANKVPARDVRGLKAWDARALGDAIAKAAGTEPAKANARLTTEIVIVDGSTIVIAEASNIDNAVAAATGGTPWRHEGLAASAALARRSGAKGVTLALGENTTDVTLRIHADFVDEAAAKKKVGEAKGMLGFGAMMMMPADKDSPEAAANKAALAELIRRITITQDGAAADANLDYPVQKLAQQLVEIALKRREKAAATGK